MPFISAHDIGCKTEVYVIARVASDVMTLRLFIRTY